MFRTYLKEQVWEKAGHFLAARFRDSGALVLWTGSDGFDYCQFSSQLYPGHLRRGPRSTTYSRFIPLLLGEAGAEGLTSPTYPGLTFSFVRPDRTVEERYHPGQGLLVMPTVMTFRILEDENAPPFVCLVQKSDAEYRCALPGSP